MSKAFFSAFVVLLLSWATQAQTHKGISFQGVIKLPSGELPTRSGITVNARILSSNDCILREEQFSGVNISNGYINLAIGTGSVGGSDPGFSMKQVMDNSNIISGLVCLLADGSINGAVTSFNPATSNGVRKFRMSFTLDSAPVVADFNMRSMAYAVNAESLDGKAKADFINVNGAQGLTQANAESIFNRYTQLNAILGNFNAGGTSLAGSVSGTATNVTGVVAIANGGTGASTLANAKSNLGIGTVGGLNLPAPLDSTKVLLGDGTWAALPSGGGSGTVTSVTAGTGLIHVTSPGNPLTGAGELAVNVGTGNNQIVQMTGAGKLPAVDGSNLTNVTASALSNTASINTSGNIVTTGNVQAGSSVTAKNIYVYDSAGTPASIGLIAPADIVAAGGASYVLTLPEKKGTVGQVLAAKDANGVLEWVSPAGGSITAVTADTPLVIDNSVAGSPKVTLPKANTSTSGYLDNADWNTFNGKQPAGSYITTLTGDVSSSLFAAGSVTTSVDKIKGVAVSTAVAGDDQKFMKYVHGSGWTPQFVKLSELRNIAGTASAFNVGACTSAQTLVWSSLTDQFACQDITLPSGKVTGLATVATTGSYSDLTGKPTLGSLAAKSAVDLSTAEVTGVLPVARGGTNSGTALNNNRVMVSSGGGIVENAAITAARAIASDANGLPVAATTTSAELDYLSGVTSSVQTQLNTKASSTGWANYSVMGTNGSGALTAITGSVTGSVLQYSGTGAYYSAASYPSSTTANQLLYSSASNVVGGLATANNAILTTNGSGVPSWSVISNDVFTQYVKLTGRAGGQDVKGGTAANENLTLDSTNHGTKGYVLLNPTGGSVGVGTSAPGYKFEVEGGSINASNANYKINGWTSLSRSGTVLKFNETSQASSSMAFYTNGDTTTAKVTLDSSGNMGLGTTAPNTKLVVSGNASSLPAPTTTGTVAQFASADGGNSRVTIDGFAGVPVLDFRRADTTAASPSAVQSGDNLGQISWFGYGSSAYSSSARATIYVSAAEAWTNAATGTYMNFSTTPTGSATPAIAMTILGNGNVGVGITNPTTKLDVNGVINVNNNKITNVATPTAAADVATKAYVDAAMSGAATMISAESGSTYTYSNALAYCRGLNAACQYNADGSACGATTYTGWRLPRFDEITPFTGFTASTVLLFTITPWPGGSGGEYHIVRLSDGYWSQSGFGSGRAVRCVR